MNSGGHDRPGLPASCLAGAAGGGLALAGIAGAEVLFRLGPGPAVSDPLRDLSTLAVFGSVAGVGLGAARHFTRELSPFGILLGFGVALHPWLAGVSGSGVLGEGVVRLALTGALRLIIGAAAGQAIGWAALRRMRWSRPRPVRDTAVVVLLALPLLRPVAGGAPEDTRPSVLLLTIDTLRADRLGYAGHPAARTPHLDRLARRGAVHDRAVTPLPRTLPALASLMTASDPHRHGVRDNFHYALGPDAQTLAEILGERGWICGAVNSNPVLSHDSGIYQGFRSANDRGDDWARLGILRGANRIRTLLAMRRGDRDRVITDLALRWMRHRPKDRPYFLWVHWLAPHMPYEPSAPFDRVFDPDYDGRFRHAITYEEISKGDMTYRNPLTSREREHAVALYDGEVATSDRAVGRLLSGLELSGDLDARTLVVFTADHGESLVEHGYFFNHGDFVYGPAVNVPLVFARGLPTGTPQPVECTPVTSLSDIRPMIAALALRSEDPSPRPRVFGESGFCRFPHLNDRLGWQLPREIAQSPETIPDWSTRWAEQANRAKQRFVLDGDGWKLVRSPFEKGDRQELFDVRSDPGETRDVSAAHPAITRDLGAKLDRWVARGEEAGTTAEDRTLDRDTREQMEALGYVGE